MKRFLAYAALVAIVAIGASVATTGSAGAVPPQGECPPRSSPTAIGWSLQPLANVDPALDVGNFHDQNGDALVCVRINTGLTKKTRPSVAWTVKDNTN